MTKIYNKKLKSGSKKWISRQIHDEYTQKKISQGFRSRSAFKLLEIEKKFKILKNNSSILDLGATPGGWSQVLAKKVKNGKIVATDILPMKEIENVSFILGDFLNIEVQKKILSLFNCKIDIIVSDMAVNTTGNKHLDSYRATELVLNAIKFSKTILKKNGIFLSKIFMGSEFEEIKKNANLLFEKVFFYKPKSSRKESKELYILCKYVVY